MVAVLSLSSACATIERAPFTRAQQDTAVIPGIPDARFWADGDDTAARLAPPIGRDGRRIAMLALSGGSDDGAYGAGLLNGWSQSGRRPAFDIVTGVSTGALIAPFAFLGSRHDAALTQVYTTISARDIYRARFPLAIPGSTSAASTKPLARLIARYATDALIDEVAREHGRGRRLFVGTVNLDAQRMVVWDMGAIAASAAPNRRMLFRQVLLASASVPAVFPPVPIDAVSGGRLIRELHVDGGTVGQVLTVPAQLVIGDRPAPDSGRLTLYVLVNNRLGGDFQIVRPKVVPILKRALALDLQSALVAQIDTSYLYARDHGVDFNLSYIGNEFPSSAAPPFNTAYMRRLYAYGLARGRMGDFWRKRPPDAAQQQAGKAD